MPRKWFIASIAALSFASSACGDYDEKNAAYDGNNASYDSSNASYDAGNAAYDETGNAAYDPSDANAAYPPPTDSNVSSNIGATPPANPTTNGY